MLTGELKQSKTNRVLMQHETKMTKAKLIKDVKLVDFL